MYEKYDVKTFQFSDRIVKLMNNYKITIAIKFPQYVKREAVTDFDWRNYRDILDMNINIEFLGDFYVEPAWST